MTPPRANKRPNTAAQIVAWLFALARVGLGVAMPNQRAALRWMLACVALGGACLVMALRT